MIGIAITTHNRRALFLRALQQWQHRMPSDAVLVVVDDGSTEPVPDIPGVAVIRHDTPKGIASAKNACIAALMDAGADDLFLADDDCWPLTPKWWRPYTDDPEPHLMHCWGRSRFIRSDGRYTYWTYPRGVMIYTHRTVIDKVGGMRPEFDPVLGHEHVEWSLRIHNTGLTRHPYTDMAVALGRRFWHAEDVWRRTPSSINDPRRCETTAARDALFEHFKTSTDYVDYR